MNDTIIIICNDQPVRHGVFKICFDNASFITFLSDLAYDAELSDKTAKAGQGISLSPHIRGLLCYLIQKAPFEVHWRICQDMTKLDFSKNIFDGICSYYAIIHIPREDHQPLLAKFHRMLKPNGFALLCLGAEHLIDDIDEDYLGTHMYWSHYDTETYLKMLNECGFSIIWSKRVADGTCEGAGHLFVLAQKSKQ